MLTALACCLLYALLRSAKRHEVLDPMDLPGSSCYVRV